MSTGFVAIQGNRFTLNGQSVKLKGTNYQDPASPWAPLKKWDPDAARRGLALAEELGMNCARLWCRDDGHDPLPSLLEFLDIAERYGIRAYPVLPWPWQAEGIERFADDPKVFEYIRDFVAALKDDPRIIAWDLMNEADWVRDDAWHWTMSLPDAEHRLRWFKRAVDEIKEVDDNHPISMGATFSYSLWRPALSLPNGPAEPFTLESIVDFADFHYYRRNYRESTLAEEIRAVKDHTDKPVITGEFGFATDPNWSTPGEEVHSEELQVEKYAEYLGDCEQEDIAGLMQWCLIDYHGTIGNGEEFHGILRTDYSRKPAAEVFQRRFPVERVW
jgi:endo-1,4-beta-mannosidase